MSTKPLFVVFGATGSQGGSVVNAILANQQLASKYRIRGVCRDVTRPAATILQQKGIEVISANLSSRADVSRALEGAEVVFLVTAYSGNGSDANVEIQQGKLVADIAKTVGVQHLIFSSLLSATRLSTGNIHHAKEFDSKADIEDYMRQLNVPATFVMPGFYMDLFSPGRYLRPANHDGSSRHWLVPAPVESAKIPLIDMEEDFGRFVTAAVLNRDAFLGKRLYAAQGYYTPAEIRDVFNSLSSTHGMTSTAAEISDRDYLESSQTHLGAGQIEEQREELAMWQLLREYGYYAGSSLDDNSEILGGTLSTFEKFLSRTHTRHMEN